MHPKTHLSLFGLITLCVLSVAHANPVYRAEIEKRVDLSQEQFCGEVIDSQTQTPLSGATVKIPDLNYSSQTDASGKYCLPNTLGQKPVIMSIEKSGYGPLSASVSTTVPPLFKIQLSKIVNEIILDSVLRHLGDGSYATVSSNATEFQKDADGPGLRIPFDLQGVSLSEKPYIQIGSIIGIDTGMAHFVEKNPIQVSAGPLKVKLNGSVIAEIQVNGDNKKVAIPKGLLKPKGVNTLEIEAGSHMGPFSRIDYDDMELLHIVLHL